MATDSPIRKLFAKHAGVVLSVPELARLMGMGENTVLRYIGAGQLPAIQLDRGWKILTDDAIAFFEARYTGSGAVAGDALDEPEATEATRRRSPADPPSVNEA